jgi:rifampicin phosphotransferase
VDGAVSEPERIHRGVCPFTNNRMVNYRHPTDRVRETVDDRWITDDEPSTRFPHYTRANADEVGPDPFSPLGWSLGWVKGCIPGVADGFVNFGVVRRDELRSIQPEVFGNWGGYFYNQLTLPRLMGVRMPGASPDGMDRAFFGDHPGVPDFVVQPHYEDTQLSNHLGRSMAWVMSADDYPLMDEWAVKAREFRSSRPDLPSLSDEALVERARSTAPLIASTWDPYCQVCFGSSMGAGAIHAIADALGRGEDSTSLISAVGNVESAEASVRMWDLGRIVTASVSLTAHFDKGVDDLLDRLRDSDADPEISRFLAGFAELLVEFGHRGPNEWDMRPHSWETKPELALGMIDKLRHQDEARAPGAAKERNALRREALLEELAGMLGDDTETIATLRAGARSASVFFALREKGKNACIRLINEAKVAFFELGRRLVERGHLDHPQQLFMLLDEELDLYLTDPTVWLDDLRERETSFLALHDLEPPYIVDAADGVPPISAWPPRGSHHDSVATAVSGERLVGAGAAPGVVTGRARIVLDPENPGELQPGDILVVHTTDPSWTPLFLAVAGVVCNVGAVSSHAAIVSRELGVPCAVSVVAATSRIPDGAIITLDGSTGHVRVDQVPD